MTKSGQSECVTPKILPVPAGWSRIEPGTFLMGSDGPRDNRFVWSDPQYKVMCHVSFAGFRPARTLAL